MTGTPPPVGTRLRNTSTGSVYVVTRHVSRPHLHPPEVLLRLAVLAKDGDPTGSTISLASGHVTDPGTWWRNRYVVVESAATTQGCSVGPSLTEKVLKRSTSA